VAFAKQLALAQATGAAEPPARVSPGGAGPCEQGDLRLRRHMRAVSRLPSRMEALVPRGGNGVNGTHDCNSRQF
jgi:hypothetical protein